MFEHILYIHFFSKKGFNIVLIKGENLKNEIKSGNFNI